MTFHSLAARVKHDAARHVVQQFTTSWRDGTAHAMMSPLGFMRLLAAPVTAPGC
jgi:hypothetical protein